MKFQDTAFSSLRAANLPSSIVSYLHNVADEYEEYPVKGGLLKDIRYGWLASGSKFAVVNLKTSQKIAAWNFGTDLREYDSKITSVCELPTHLTTTSKQLLVGLECNIIGGMVCLFHCDGSRILRVIQMDCKVTCLTALDEVPMGPFSCFDGTVLVGTQGGALLAFDLNRQRCFEAISHAAYGNNHLIRDERNMARLAVLSLDDISVIDEQRAIACNRDDHIAVQLNEGCFHGKQFYLYNPDSTVRFQSSRDEVFISQTLYVPQLASMIVGFSYGAFQIWNLVSTELDFTSQVSVECLPITQLAFQEPSDDPCAFSYLWVIYSAIDKYDDGFPIAAMYSLRYQGKKVINNSLCLYQDFIKCTLRFQIELTSPEFTNIPLNNLIGGRCITCHSVSKTVTNKSDDADETIINLCQISWECWQANRQTPAVTYMILFDLDQWYKEHMPDSSRVETNSFVSFVNLTPCITNNSNSHFCDVKLDVASLSQFSCVQKLEEHFFPNSYAYDCTCLVSVESVWISTLGVQRQLLSTLNSLGPSILLNPARIYKQCIDVGLVPIYFDVPPGIAPLSVQRALVLSVALAARLWRLLLRCARESPVTDASHDAEAQSQLPPLAEWAWDRAAALRSAAHTLTRPLWVPTMPSGAQSCGIKSGPDRNSLCLLRECTAQLASLDSLLCAILENTAERVGLDVVYNITQRKNAVHMVSLYFKVIQWFVDVGLLPEYHLNEDLHLLNGSVQRLPYPIDTLVRSYQNRRCQLFRLQGKSSDIVDTPPKSCPLLFIDRLIEIECSEDKLRSIWKDDGSTTDGLYPPPSLHSLLKVYLQPEILEDTKHSLVLYTLEDYAVVFGERYSDAIRRLMQFPTMMEMSNTDIKITQAFWHLDHRCFDFALEQLWGLCTSNGSSERWSWVQNAVVASLTAQHRAQVALQWLAGSGITKRQQSTDDDMAMDMDMSELQTDSSHKGNSTGSLYLARRSPEAAFDILRYSNPQRQDYLHFFNECKRIGLLSKISKIPLTKREEDLFISFLRRSKGPQMVDILIMFYLQRARYAEALSVKCSEKEPNAETWSLLVQMYCSGIPTLATLTSALPSITGNMSDIPIKVTEPTPMSVFVEPKTPQPVTYKSSLIQSVITHASETWMEKPALTRGLKRALEAEDTPFICTPKIRRTGRSYLTNTADQSNEITTDDGSQTKKTIDYNTPVPRTKLTLHSEYSTPALESDLQSMLHSPAVEKDMRWNAREPLSPDSPSMREHTPQSILKVRKLLHHRDNISPNDIRYYGETDEELETSSQHTQHSDAVSLSRSIRFTIPYGEYKDRETTPTSLSDVTFTDENNEYSLSIQSQIESASNYSLPRKKFASVSEDESIQDANNKSPRRHLPDRNSSCPTENDAIYSPNESIADILPEIYPTSAKILLSVHNDNAFNMLPEKATPAETNLESVQADVLQSGDEYVSSDRSPTKTKMDSVTTPPSILGTPESSEKAFGSSAEDIAKIGPRPRRSLRAKSVEAVEVPLRRSSRNRSRTPELEPSVQTASSPRAKTPTSKPRKSLSRQVLEANTFIKRDTATESSETNESRQINEIFGCSLLKDDSSTSVVESKASSDNIISTPISQFKLSEYNDSILSSCSSKSAQNTSNLDIATNSPSEERLTISQKANYSSTVTPMYQKLNLPDFNESILCSDTSDIFLNISEYATTLDINECEESEPQTSVMSNYAVESTPVSKCSLSGFNDSILSSDTSNSPKSTPILKSHQSQEYIEKSIQSKSILQEENENKSNKNVDRPYIDQTENEENKMEVDPSYENKYSEVIIDADTLENNETYRENIVNIEFDVQAESTSVSSSSSNSNNSQSEASDNEEKSENDSEVEEVDSEVELEVENEEEVEEEVNPEDIESSPESGMGDEENGSEASEYTSEEEICIPKYETSTTEESSNNEIDRNELEFDVISVSNSSSDSTSTDAPNREEGGKSKPNYIANIKDSANASDIEVTDSEPSIVLTLNSSVSEDGSVLQKHSVDPFLRSCEFETASSSKVESEDTFVSKVTTVPVEFGNFSILTDDDSYLEDRVALQSDGTVEPLKSPKLIESPVKVVVTDTEGRSTVEIDEGIEFSEVMDKNNVEIENLAVVTNRIDEDRSADIEITNAHSEVETEEYFEISSAINNNNISSANLAEVIIKADENKSTEMEITHETPDLSKISASETLTNKNSDKNKIIAEKVVKVRSRKGSITSEDGEDKRKTNEYREDFSGIHNIPKSPSRRKSPLPERMTRSRAKSMEIESIASDASFTDSVKSGDRSVSQLTRRKSKKSILPVKADLSVIPEDGSSKLDITEVQDESKLEDYSKTRRLTRNQRAMLNKSANTAVRKITTRHSSVASIASIAGSGVSESFDDDRSNASIISIEAIDPISLLDRVGVTGRTSRAASDSAIEPIKRTRRASADIDSPVIITRRSSVDIPLRLNCESPIEFHTSFALDSPSTPGSSGRPRRQSFTKAIEALHHPRKGRRLSMESKPDDSDIVNTSATSSTSKIRIGTHDTHGTSILEPVLEDDESKITPRRRLRRAASETSNMSTVSVESKASSRRSRTGSTAKK